jgi:hypothetical protein
MRLMSTSIEAVTAPDARSVTRSVPPASGTAPGAHSCSSAEANVTGAA